MECLENAAQAKRERFSAVTQCSLEFGVFYEKKT
jgi:hypothetical protein